MSYVNPECLRQRVMSHCFDILGRGEAVVAKSVRAAFPGDSPQAVDRARRDAVLLGARRTKPNHFPGLLGKTAAERRRIEGRIRAMRERVKTPPAPPPVEVKRSRDWGLFDAS